MFAQHFQRDFDVILSAPKPFALVRFHDGEHAILENLPYSAASKWSVVGKEVWLRNELEQILSTQLEDFHVGLSPPCCAPRATHYYRGHVHLHRSRQTFATIFSNRNFRRVPRLRAVFKDAVVVSSGQGDIHVPANGVTREWDVDAVVEKLLDIDRPIMVAAGPCANIIIHRYWSRQDVAKRQTILDVGAALDMFVHGHHTRHYQETTSKALYHECEWDTWAPWAPVSQRARDGAERSARQHDIFAAMQGKKLPGARNITKRSPYSGARSASAGTVASTVANITVKSRVSSIRKREQGPKKRKSR